MNIPLILRIKSLSVLCTFVLAGSVQFVRAAERGPASRTEDGKLSQVGSSASAKRRIPQPHHGTAALLATNLRSNRPGRTLRPAPANARRDDEIAALKQQLARQESMLLAQQERLTRLETMLNELRRESVGSSELSFEHTREAQRVEVASPLAKLPPLVVKGDSVENSLTQLSLDAARVHPHEVASLAPATEAPAGFSSPAPAQAGQDQAQAYITRLERLNKQVEGISNILAGFRFSGSLRLRSDNTFRSSNSVTGPVQRSRGQYRARLNLDKGINDQLAVHFQLGSGRFDNPLTDDTDFAGGAVRGPIFLTEVWADYHPNSNLSLRGGKMPEVFQDYVRFMWDEDVRFNGFQESVGTPLGDNPLGITRIDFRAGQYPLTDPNIQVLPSAAQCASATAPAACGYLKAGYRPGEHVRAADLFDQGVFVKGRIKPGWSHYLFSSFVIFRNPNQIALASTSSGLPLLVNPDAGVTLAGPLPGTGTATTIPGGGIYTASHFQIGRLAYRITKEGWKFRDEEFPVFLDVQASRNFGTSFLRNAWMATLNGGEVRKAGDVRFLYSYAVKDANSMISQFADDHIGTLSGVNIRTHALRFDLGLAKYLQWQNAFYIQNEISPNDPARHFYVTLPRGTPTQYRMESSVFVNF